MRSEVYEFQNEGRLAVPPDFQVKGLLEEIRKPPGLERRIATRKVPPLHFS